ncbi:MAG TPA: hypothetical protein ENF92_07815 [Desulfobacteraceae bacterium]|nr:hypothetical protein [Desulfobacteraceae bacterium]
MPEDLAKEVLRFIEYIEKRHQVQNEEIQNLKQAQLLAMNEVWDNVEDSVWDED